MRNFIGELKKTFAVIKWALLIYFKGYPVYTTIFFTAQIILSTANIVNAYIIAIVTDKAIDVLTSKSLDFSSFLPIVSLIIGSYIFYQFIEIVNTYVWRIVTYQDSYNLRKILLERLKSLGIQKLEDPEITNKAQRFHEEMGSISHYLESITIIISSFVSFMVAGIVIFKSMPLVGAFYFVVMIIRFISNQKFIRELWLFGKETTEERRKSNTSLNLLSEPASLKELILSNGSSFLLDKVDNYLKFAVNKISEIRFNWTVWKMISISLDATVFGYGIVVILKRLVGGLISIGQLTFELRSLRIFADSFANFTSNIVDLRESTIRIGEVYELFTRYEVENDGDIVLQDKLESIEIKNIRFKYPKSEKYIFNDLDLKINKGEKIAIVGENGAGKTTLVKLLCRIYRPDEGDIKINDTNINMIKIQSWYKKLSILFQDYTMYTHLTVKENLEVDSIGMRSTDETIKDALKKSSAIKFVEKYNDGVNQILSERYKGGIRPSTGQWQKIAIARVFHRNAPVLILDEPTASIDAVAEAKIFDNIYKFAKDKTVIIISHRFSTVRNADRIIVLDKGKIIEQGSHEELIKNNGKYARAFKLQAKGYQ